MGVLRRNHRGASASGSDVFFHDNVALPLRIPILFALTSLLGVQLP